MPVPKVVFSTQALPDGFYELHWTLMAFNGQRQIVESDERSFFYHLSDCDTNQNPLHLAVIAGTLNKKGILLDCTSSTVPVSEFSTVDTGTFLLAAIDPPEENQLVHLDTSITSGRMLTLQDDLHPDPNPDISTIGICQNPPPQVSASCTIPNLDIPVLFQTQLPGQITLKGSFARLATGSLDPQIVADRGGGAYLAHLPQQEVIFNGEVPLVQNEPQRFSVHELVWDGQSWQAYGSGDGPTSASLKFLYTASSLTYLSTTAPTGQTTPAYTLVPNGIQGPEAAFRTLHPLHDERDNMGMLQADNGLGFIAKICDLPRCEIALEYFDCYPDRVLLCMKIDMLTHVHISKSATTKIFSQAIITKLLSYILSHTLAPDNV